MLLMFCTIANIKTHFRRDISFCICYFMLFARNLCVFIHQNYFRRLFVHLLAVACWHCRTESTPGSSSSRPCVQVRVRDIEAFTLLLPPPPHAYRWALAFLTTFKPTLSSTVRPTLLTQPRRGLIREHYRFVMAIIIVHMCKSKREGFFIVYMCI